LTPYVHNTEQYMYTVYDCMYGSVSVPKMMYIHRKHVRANPNNSARRYSRRNLSVRTGPFGRSCCKKAEAASRKMRLTTVSVQRDCGATIAALCVLLDLNTHTHVHTYTHMYTRTHALMHTHMLHTRTHAQEHTHTPVL